jgi:hypothetical protein
MRPPKGQHAVVTLDCGSITGVLVKDELWLKKFM